MATKTGSIYISESMTSIFKILTANVGFMTIESSKKVSSSDRNDGRLPEIEIWPPKPEILIDSLEL